MNRRNFLRATGALGLPAFFGSSLSAASLKLLRSCIDEESDKVLVLIRLAGGNDSLNTLVGLDQLDKLHQVRPSLALPESSLLSLTDTTSLHGSMLGMKSLFDDGKLNAIQAVGYPDQNRSHFRSTDIWTSASSANEFETSGWLGRHLQQDHPDYPSGYPNEAFSAPLAITMGNVLSETCQGMAGNFGTAVNNPFNFLFIAPGGDSPLPVDTYYGDEVSYIRNLIGQSNEYGAIVQESAEAGNSLAENYTEGKLSQQLRNIAYLISGGLKTKIYVATLTGFDTHASQVTGESTMGTHADLLRELSDSIKAFQDDLAQLGLADRVMGMTFSEFGRRIKDNGSNGSDHGDAGAMFLFGNCVTGGVIGENPIIDTAVDQRTGVPFQYDFRDVYGTVLTDWFEVPEATVRQIIRPEFQRLPILNDCSADSTTSTTNGAAAGWLVGQPMPNPIRYRSRINVFTPVTTEATVQIIDLSGKVLNSGTVQLIGGQENQLPIQAGRLPAGTYIYRISTATGANFSRNFLKQ